MLDVGIRSVHINSMFFAYTYSNRDREKREFIREQAMRLTCVAIVELPTGISTAEAEAVWSMARQMWEAKPEDC